MEIDLTKNVLEKLQAFEEEIGKDNMDQEKIHNLAIYIASSVGMLVEDGGVLKHEY